MRTRRIIVSVTSALLIVLGVVGCFAFDKIQKIKEKVAKVQVGIKNQALAGKDCTTAMSLLQKAKSSFDKHDSEHGLALLDQALQMLGADAEQPDKSADGHLLPIYTKKEETTDLYQNPELVEIEGYSKDCMEPCISPDGRYLFFNNSNEPNVSTHIHYAKRLGPTKFKYLGILEGTTSDTKDMAPTMDLQGNFYFTSLRSFSVDHKSFFAGNFMETSDGATVRSVKSVNGDIWPAQPFWIDMDCGIRPDGRVLVLSRALFLGYEGDIKQSDLLYAELQGGKFVVNPNVALLSKINTVALEYAPAISADGLELYFTRASEPSKNGEYGGLRIMVATRSAADECFNEPKALKDINGFVEAPSLSLDKGELFFHKKYQGKFRIARAVRKRAQ